MTVQIALCDDESAELDKLEHMLQSWRRQHAECDFFIERFLDADEMLFRILKEGYAPDLLLLDIYLQGKQGMEVAKEIRKMERVCIGGVWRRRSAISGKTGFGACIVSGA